MILKNNLATLNETIKIKNKRAPLYVIQEDKSGSLNIEEIQKYFKHTKINHSRWQKAVKSCFDIFFSSIALILSIPIFILTAIAIKLESNDSIFFKQKRVGKKGKLFTFYKFRSMTENAESLKESLKHLNEMDGPCFKIKNDPRITKVGKFIRKTSIDELPQLWNVLKRDMSLVGPRPLPADEVLNMEIWHLNRLKVLPGITCLWQVNGRSNVSFYYWMKLDAEYIKKWSFLLDLKLLLLTIPTVLFRIGAF
ncbi:MAG: sugar transferase [bacterium]|nr:sugar transferase [bacterium]